LAVSAAHLNHLVRRFVGSLRPGGPAADDERWARDHLLPGEMALWDRMSGADRRHAIGVARRAATQLDGTATRPVVAAALLHDVGKVDAEIGPVRRAVATVVALLLGHDRARGWRDRPGARGRLGRYLCHDVIGADLLRQAGSDDLTVRWAREHHLPPARWSVPEPVGAALKSADDD
jgi:HD domain